MKREKISGFSGRHELIECLIRNYRDGSAPQVILLTGPSGCGKSFVANRVVEEFNRLPQMSSYIDRGDSFASPSTVGSPSKLNSLSLSVGTPVMSIGIGAGVQRAESQYNHLKALLGKSPNTTLLICLDNLSTSHSDVKSMAKILLSHCEDLEKKLSIHIYFLITDTSLDLCMSFVLSLESIAHIELEPYGEDDILKYLKSQHLELTITKKITQNISEIQKISNGNLSLANFLFVDITIQDSDYFKALEQVIRCRLFHLKEEGQRKEISETEMEDIILSSALSLQRFTTAEISSVTQRTDNAVANSLDIARKEALVDKAADCFYDFCCPEVKSALEEQSIKKRKERLLYYYKYYTQNEQDEYYIRAFYLTKYFGTITHQSFALLGLAYASGLSRSDSDLLTKIDATLQKYGSPEQLEQYENIKSFYAEFFKSAKGSNYKALQASYQKLNGAGFEAPLRCELARAYFHYLYRNHSPVDKTLQLLFNECLAFAEQEVALNDFQNPIGLNPGDETIVRLNVIYSIAPYLLDVRNDVKNFTRLYQLSRTMSKSCHSKSAKGLAKYIENVFNRKAFLFANQTQCGPYYECAKAYFSRNQIWDEMCLTLVCQAGTDIVIQKYDEAQVCCKQAIEIADCYGIVLPQPAKLQNNLLIAEFLEVEERANSEKVRLANAKRTITQLKKQLSKDRCATEYVILTNICSLCLYCGNDKEYMKHRSILQSLMSCPDVSDIADEDIDDFYRYYFAWFEAFRMLRDGEWDSAERLYQSIRGFVPALFQKQEIFWEMKEQALADLIKSKTSPSPYDFCNKLVHINRRENILSQFFFRGLMLSDLQYTSYN